MNREQSAPGARLRGGRLVTFEGPDGSGKTTHIERLAKRLAASGLTVLCTREPGGTEVGEAIRGMLQHDAVDEPLCNETEALLFGASRAQLVRRVIVPALERGDVVLCDRFGESTLAYQGYGRGLGVEAVGAINRLALGDVVPDLTLVLDIDPAEGLARRQRGGPGAAEGHDRIERETLEFHMTVRQAYLALIEQNPARMRRVDAGQKVEQVAAEIWEIVKGFLGLEEPTS